MKRVLILIAAICAAGGALWAQESGSGTDEDYVLQKARDEYNAANTNQTTITETQTTTVETQTTTTVVPATPQATTKPGTTTITIEIPWTPAPVRVSRESEHPYFPFVFSFVPGLSFPFGIYDTSFSAAPIGALTGSVNGVQGAGVFNIADGSIHGMQGAGVFNIAGQHVGGFQGAGVFNIAQSVRGAQGSGVFNIAEEVSGIQMAGVFNIADEMHGVQMAGVFNIADKADGAMIGLVNIADELDGVAIGLVNIIGNGIHDFALDYQFDSKMTYAAYRSGTPFLYAAFTAGQPSSEFLRTAEGLTAGAALGHRFKFLFLTADIELGVETPVDPASIELIYNEFANFDHADWYKLGPVVNSFRSFGSLRASFGFGNRRGFGPYLGIKADFAPTGSALVPAAMRSSFGGAEPYTVTLFDTNIDIWPKWFLGVKF
ncbi:MAG: hypothetical protein A2Y38_02415 [Spirochaetes bacterium GWB1_59_5]|nr:MAG: hypothetical protein A2Y38_02415 [Spirochaetes bacterium GWB1_59_5]